MKKYRVTIDLDAFEIVVSANNKAEAKRKAIERLQRKKITSLIRKSWPDNKKEVYVKENICEPKFFESFTVVVTHGVLEHFSDTDITRIVSTYNNDKVLFQAHYVPTCQYASPSFGDERLLPIDYWITLVKPDYYLLDNNGKDLYMFKTKSAPTRR